MTSVSGRLRRWSQDVLLRSRHAPPAVAAFGDSFKGCLEISSPPKRLTFVSWGMQICMTVRHRRIMRSGVVKLRHLPSRSC